MFVKLYAIKQQAGNVQLTEGQRAEFKEAVVSDKNEVPRG